MRHTDYGVCKHPQSRNAHHSQSDVHTGFVVNSSHHNGTGFYIKKWVIKKKRRHHLVPDSIGYLLFAWELLVAN